MRIFVYKDTVLNVDNDNDAGRLLSQGARELTDGEITAAGMTGYEHLVSPANTTVGEDGRIIFTPPEPEPLETVKARKMTTIDAETSAAILAGFEYTIDGTPYHFSYDSFDQQNFSDTANMCQLALAGTPGLPTSVVWNSYLPDGTLVQQTFDAQSFLALYTAGAMAHKATQMSIGGQRKAKVWAAQTKEEIEAI